MLNSLISSDQLTPDVVAEALRVAGEMQKICDEKRRVDLLADKVVALIFLEPSSRTMLSFQAAVQRLSAAPLLIQGKETSSVSKGESIADTMKTVSGYAELIVARLYESGTAAPAAEASSVPFINAGDGANEHPTQALIDAYTIHRALGSLEGLHVAFGFDPLHSRSIHSLVKLLSQYKGVRFTFVSPLPLKAPPALLGLLESRGISYTEAHEMEALRSADVIYLNRLQEERFENFAQFQQYRYKFSLLPEMVTPANKLILDPLPRVDEIAVSVDDLPQAAYFRQAHNGVPVRMALLALMLGRA
jgi:aspartate carbamoyltransferase